MEFSSGNKLPSSTNEREFMVAEKFADVTQTWISNYMKLSEYCEIICESFTMQKIERSKNRMGK